MIEITKDQLGKLLYLGYVDTELPIEREEEIAEVLALGPLVMNDEEYKYQLKEKICNVMEVNVRSPVQVVFSSGVDSTMILLMAIRAFGKDNVSAITLENEKYISRNKTEAMAAKDICDSLGVEIDVVTFPINADTLIFDKITEETYKDLFISSSLIPIAYVYNEAYNKVLLTGDGGDELFCGYDRYLFANFFDESPSIKKFFRMLPNKTHRMRKAKSFLENGNYFDLMSLFSIKEIEKLTGQNQMLLLGNLDETLWKYSNIDSFNRYMMLDIVTELYGVETRKINTAARIANKEIVSPFLDKEVIDFSCRLPMALKYRKKILRDIISGWIPDYKKIVGKAKRGFSYTTFDPMLHLNSFGHIYDVFYSSDVNDFAYDHKYENINNSEKLFAFILLEKLLNKGILKII